MEKLLPNLGFAKVPETGEKRVARMEIIRTQDAVGTVICHDITKIVPGQFKGRAFKKGHIIRQEDIPELLRLGKEHLYVWQSSADKLHEDEAARLLAEAVAGPGVILQEAGEGKVNLVASEDGLLITNIDGIEAVNDMEEIAFATLRGYELVKKGEKVSGIRVIPLVIDRNKISQVQSYCQNKPSLIQIKKIQPLTVGIITTGGEVYHGRIKDAFGPVIRSKVEALGCQVLGQSIVPDDPAMITEAINKFIAQGAGMIITTGGMSVDPDDVTPMGIRSTGAEIVTYGVPVLPGSMFLLAYLGQIPIMGLPGCVMYNKITIFDLVLPRILAGIRLNRRDLVKMGHGGLCRGCQNCHFPDCAFGKE